jgi:hypothetical protein
MFYEKMQKTQRLLGFFANNHCIEGRVAIFNKIWTHSKPCLALIKHKLRVANYLGLLWCTDLYPLFNYPQARV